MKNASVLSGWVLSFAAAISLIVAWWMPGSPTGAALGWTSAVLWCSSFRHSTHRLRRAYVAGCVTYAGGFYWLYNTISEFGGFPLIAALAVFGLFVCGSAVQFLFCAFIWGHIPKVFTRLGLRTVLSWLIAQHFWIRIFPWDFGHTQIGFLPFAQIADVGGVWLVTSLMLWVCESVSDWKGVNHFSRACALGAFALSLGYGIWMIEYIPNQFGPSLRTVMVQGNVSLQQKHDVKYFSVNRERYLTISKTISKTDTLVVWPESTITDAVPAELGDARFSKILPFLNDGSAFLIGAITYRKNSEEYKFYNSSMLIRPDGSIPAPYNKIVLMPFGEYTPLGDIFPFIKEINSTAGGFTAGEKAEVLAFPLSSGGEVKLSPLICYEDITPALARDAVQAGTELLVNQTNDAWFGDSIAPFQHHMIATFRAIENRRYLLRSTNTGLTAIVDPLGQTIGTLPTFSEGTIDMQVNLIRYRSIYSTLPVEGLWLWLSVIVLLWTLYSACRRSRIA